MEFLVRFSDGDEKWLQYSTDISMTLAFAEFCKLPPLSQLLRTVKEVSSWERLEKRNFEPQLVHSAGVLLLRTWSAEWYESLPLEDLYTKKYVVRAYVQSGREKYKDYTVKVPFFNISQLVNHWFMVIHLHPLRSDEIVVDDLL